jgi:hypothetical protein
MAEQSSLRSWATLIASVAGLVTAIGAVFKPQDHTVTQESYEALSQEVHDLVDQQAAEHDDLVALRAYLEGLGTQPCATASVNPPMSLPSPSPMPKLEPPPVRSSRPKFKAKSFDKVLADVEAKKH